MAFTMIGGVTAGELVLDFQGAEQDGVWVKTQHLQPVVRPRQSEVENSILMKINCRLLVGRQRIVPRQWRRIPNPRPLTHSC